MIYLRLILTPIIMLLALVAMVSTFNFTTQDHVDDMLVMSVIEVEQEEAQTDDDEGFPHTSLVEEELLHPTAEIALSIPDDFIQISYPLHLNLVSQHAHSDLLKPPTL